MQGVCHSEGGQGADRGKMIEDFLARMSEIGCLCSVRLGALQAVWALVA